MVSAGLIIRFSEQGGASIILEYTGVPRHTDRQQIEFLVTSIVRICRVLTGRKITPISVRLKHFRAEEAVEFSRFLGSKVAFGTERDEIAFERAVRELKLLHADPSLNLILAKTCAEEISRGRRSESPCRIAVENALAPLLPHGGARVESVARKLGLSKRTLTRRLSEEGVAFSRIKDELRQTLAVRYLQDSALSISQVAWLLGYEQVSAFTHACRRWRGTSPRQTRDWLLSRSPVGHGDGPK